MPRRPGRARAARRVGLQENIQGTLISVFPGQTAVEKRAKGELLKAAFGTYSWSDVEGMSSETLENGLAHIRAAIAAAKDPNNQVAEALQIGA